MQLDKLSLLITLTLSLSLPGCQSPAPNIVKPAPNPAAELDFKKGETVSSPELHWVSQPSGLPATTVLVVGKNLTDATQVIYNGEKYDYQVHSDTLISITVPNASPAVSLTVTTPGGTANLGIVVNLSPGLPTSPIALFSPSITSFSPSSGAVGSAVELNGLPLGSVTQVLFNGVEASFTINSGVKITAIVPEGATDGKITVKNEFGSASSSATFDVTN